ncbi:MAG: small ribosomal subunit Rsm22 family protein [Treponema sp.]|jgi:hypothetical protein|nr:small ribosomal subunit Rsm22 family protein [Treponema sp.]
MSIPVRQKPGQLLPNLLSCTPALERLLRIIEKTFPVPGRFRSNLPGDVAELSRLLTSARSGREGGYLSRPNLLSAYLRYFLPWNVFRLYRLFSLVSGADSPPEETGDPSGESGDMPGGPAGPFLGLTGGDAITDIGSGPLTLPVALWLWRPELRKLNLEFRCVDHCAPALEAGRKIFAALEAAENGSSWKIRTIHDSVNAPVHGKKARLVTAVNVFNEICRRDDSASAADKAVKILEKLCSEEGAILVMEPGIPESGAFIAALRYALLERGTGVVSPCTHEGPCPLPGEGRFHKGQGRVPGRAGLSSRFPPAVTAGGNAKWCHFAFDTAEAPEELHRLSAAAGIPKERAVFSFLLTGKTGPGGPATVRVISDACPVSGGWGRYGCGAGRGIADGYDAGDGRDAGDSLGKNGLYLIRGSKGEIERIAPGTVVKAGEGAQAEFDKKTGAIIVEPGGDLKI